MQAIDAHHTIETSMSQHALPSMPSAKCINNCRQLRMHMTLELLLLRCFSHYRLHSKLPVSFGASWIDRRCQMLSHIDTVKINIIKIFGTLKSLTCAAGIAGASVTRLVPHSDITRCNCNIGVAIIAKVDMQREAL